MLSIRMILISMPAQSHWVAATHQISAARAA